MRHRLTAQRIVMDTARVIWPHIRGISSIEPITDISQRFHRASKVGKSGITKEWRHTCEGSSRTIGVRNLRIERFGIKT